MVTFVVLRLLYNPFLSPVVFDSLFVGSSRLRNAVVTFVQLDYVSLLTVSVLESDNMCILGSFVVLHGATEDIVVILGMI